MSAVRSLFVLAIATGCSRGDATAPPVATREEAAPTPAATKPEPSREDAPARPAPAADSADPTDAGPADPAAGAGDEPAPTGAAAPTAAPPRPIDDAEGMTAEALVAAHGEPDDKKGDSWIYRYPRDGGCTDREIVYTLRVRKGTVADVQRTTRQTGQHCAPTD